MRFKDQVVIVTGSGSGFGEGIADRMAQEGAHVVVADLRAESARRVVDSIQARGGSAVPCLVDVSNGPQVQAMVDLAVERFGRVDVLVNNAGMSHANQWLLDVDVDEFDRIYAVNVRSIFLTARSIVPVFQRQGGGSIVNVASTAGVRPRPGLTWYNGSKAAVIVTSRSMAVELAPHRIRVNCVNPVIGETGLLSTFMGVPDTPENRAKFIATIPLGRMSRPTDIANAVAFLAAPESEFITGVSLEVDGGRCV